MEPLIAPGDFIEVVPPVPPFKRFDIIVYLGHDGDGLVCHYVWHRNELPSAHGQQVYVTRNLNSAYEGIDDLPVSEDKVVGQVVSHQLTTAMRRRIIVRGLLQNFRRRFFG